MNREEVPKLIRLLELLNLQHHELEAKELEIQAKQCQIQVEREAVTERLRLAGACEDNEAWANVSQGARQASRSPRATTHILNPGDWVIITNKVNLPQEIRGLRPVNEADRRGMVTLVKARKVYLVTDLGNMTWRLRKNVTSKQ